MTETKQTEMRPVMPQLNKTAPNFRVDTTAGPRKLEDYKDRWLVFFSPPADFTPICTTVGIRVSDAK